MNPLSILLLGFAMSTDAFAAAIGKGAAMTRPRLSQALRAGLIFGVIEALTPVLGWLLGRGASRYVQAWDHWIAFGLLLLLGLSMVWNSVKPKPEVTTKNQHGSIGLALTGVSTSIDALAVGVGLAFVATPIALVAAVIGLCTFSMVTLGIMLGSVLGSMVGRRAEMLGGIILIGVGSVILYGHLSA